MRIIRCISFFLLGFTVHCVQAATPLNVILDWFANPNHAPILIAANQGYFKKYGLDVTIITPADPTDPSKWVAIGKADIALDYQPHVVIEVNQGLPIKQIGTLIDKPLNSLVILASNKITKLQELKGQTVAYSSPQIDLVILAQMLHEAGISINDVNPVNVHYNLLQALLTRQAGAAIGLMRNVELVQLEMMGQPGRAFFPEDFGVPCYSELVFIAKNTVKKNQYQGFFKAINDARNYLKTHPLESFNQVIAEYRELNTEANKQIWLKTIPYFANDFSKVDARQYEHIKNFMLHSSTDAK